MARALSLKEEVNHESLLCPLYPRKQTSNRMGENVRLVPKADICSCDPLAVRARPTHQNQAIGRLQRENHYNGGGI